MSGKHLSIETKKEIARLYDRGLELATICNLLDVSKCSVVKVIHKECENGNLSPRKGNFGNSRAPNGQAKKYVKKGYNPVNKKLDAEQERELLCDYFERDMTYKQIMEKYGLWQHSIKIIVDKAIAQGIYERKGKGYRRNKGSRGP